MKPYTWLFLSVIIPTLAAAQQAAQTEADAFIGYATVQEAFEALSDSPDAQQSFYEGWTIFNRKQDGKYIIWSFTPEDHPVHPSVVRREVVSKNGEVNIAMGVLCHSSRFDCDKLIEQFEQINDNLKQRLSADSGS